MLHVIKLLTIASVINLSLVILGFYLGELLFEADDGLEWVHVASSAMALAEISAVFMFSNSKIADCNITFVKNIKSHR
jgi:hypothetical protein